jgi:hypothetical protein
MTDSMAAVLACAQAVESVIRVNTVPREVTPRWQTTLGAIEMTSREHARRLMLILLSSDGTAIRKSTDERLAGRERPAVAGDGADDGTDRDGGGDPRDHGIEEWRLWATPRPLGTARAAS